VRDLSEIEFLKIIHFQNLVRLGDMYGVEDFIEYSVLVSQVVLGLFLFSVNFIYLSNRWGAPWVITSPQVIQRMLELAELKPEEKLIDLGAGDGRILVSAVRDFGAEAIGVEIDPIRCLLAKYFIRKYGVQGKAKIRWGNMYHTDIGGADVVTLFLTRNTNRRLIPILEDRLDQGTRIVSYAFPISGWTPIIIDNTYLIFVYEMGSTGDDVLFKFA
jgi:precorrin-6B methylase 2